MWKDDNKAGCYDLYASKCQYVSREVYFPLLKNPLVEALRSSEALPKPKGAVALRKALDQFLVGAAEVSIVFIFSKNAEVTCYRLSYL